jgi:hypothetical protein
MELEEQVKLPSLMFLRLSTMKTPRHVAANSYRPSSIFEERPSKAYVLWLQQYTACCAEVCVSV